MIWEPFILALVLGIIVSAGLYFAYMWPSVEPPEPPESPEPDHDAPNGGDPPTSPEAAAEIAPATTAAPDDAASPAP